METPILAILVLVLYFLPTVIAMKRQNQSLFFILIINLALGWTFIGWIIAFIWSLSGKTLEDRELKNLQLKKLREEFKNK